MKERDSKGRIQDRQNDEAGRADRFAADTSKKTGMSERTVQRNAERGRKIGEDNLRKIAGTGPSPAGQRHDRTLPTRSGAAPKS